jgi:regulator of protease activity HflC (stomatin/prohibitin superfamily)
MSAATAAGLCCVLCVTPAAILIAVSFSTLHATEWGLDFNYVTMSIDPEPKDPGLHFIGVFHNFLRFPSTYQNLAFSTGDKDLLHTRTSDGLPLTLGISFQFTLQRAKLYDLYMKYKQDYYRVLFNVASHLIANTASNFTAYNFFNSKAEIALAMQIQLNEYCSQYLHLNVETLQITLVELPAAFEEAILESISVKQNITRTMKFKNSMEVTFQTAIMAAHQQANQTVTIAEGRAQQILAEQGANAQALTQTVSAETVAYSKVRDSLGLKNQDLIEYVFWDAMADQQSGSSFVVGMNPSTFVQQQQARP